METVRIEFKSFISEGARQFIVNGVDMHIIAATNLLAVQTSNVMPGFDSEQQINSA